VCALFLEKIIEGKIEITNPQFFDSVRSVNLCAVLGYRCRTRLKFRLDMKKDGI
jgi:hypothetical protein